MYNCKGADWRITVSFFPNFLLQTRRMDVITMKRWIENTSEVDIRKEDMNKLVMDFLVTEGHADVAKTFQRESGAEPDIDFATVNERMVILKAIEKGRVEEAIETINRWDPKILSDNPGVLFHLKQLQFIELIRSTKYDEALDFSQEELAPFGEENPSLLEELEETVLLLAFHDPANCPVGYLLDMSQRTMTAMQVNVAILHSQNHGTDPKLRIILSMLTSEQEQLGKKVTFPQIKDFSTADLVDSVRTESS